MTFKKHLPNLITLLNLLSGTIAVYFAVKEQLVLAAFFVFLGVFFDFFDGLAARLLNVQGELGKQLDSLADVVTSGVVPGIVLFQLISKVLTKGSWDLKNVINIKTPMWEHFNSTFFIAIIGLIVTLAAAYRLAKFNIDERQTSSFIGLPTPAAALVVLSLPLILAYSNNQFFINLIENVWFLIGLAMLLSYLMNAEIPLFSLKFKDYTWKNNKVKFSYILITVALCVFLQFIAIPIVIIVYVLLSLVDVKLNRKKVKK
ncbi:MAG: phosphatidylserine synthase [Lutibacter sp.]|uniref:CDP-alcohol phosphatidyltransferase family protein n=1 Tax=Lutibacter sp. TaxID=1925666 RepID=UPI0019EDE0A3|nr:CDP-alcohol phosphatidyltransferase family protein [Lutibacter sp.]NOR28995.1 phosphatidylserine synthase [Lutibacter sp.]